MLEVKNFDRSMEGEWDNFVENQALNGTFLHTRKFYDHNPLNKQDDHSFLFYKKNKLVALAPFILFSTDEKKVLHSHLRSTYGGVVMSEEVGVEEAVEIIRELLSEANKINVHEIIIRNPFRIFYKNISDEI